MSGQSVARFFVSFLLLGASVRAQVAEEEKLLKKEIITPKVIDFSRMLEKGKMTREDFEFWKRQKRAKIEERLSAMEALERAVDPEKYIVGPSDVFSFNVWGAMEAQYPMAVNPEGKLSIPSVGEIQVDGKTLAEVQAFVLGRAKPYYANSEITLTLE
ncbi:MAG: polysaccharide biosynthesis/export family protein, partial [bacterium]